MCICNHRPCTAYTYVGQRRSVEIQNKLDAVELYNNTMRMKEERTLLTVEMNNLLQFYHANILPSLSQDIQGTSISLYSFGHGYHIN